MTASQFREMARKNLTGKWGKAAVITLVYTLITFLLSFGLSFLPFIGNLVLIFLEVPIVYGILVSFIKLKRNEEVGYIDFLETAFSSIGSAWKVSGNIFLKLLLPIGILVGLMFVYFISIALLGGMTAFNAAVATGTARNVTSTIPVFAVLLVIFSIIFIIAYIAIYVWLFIKALLYSQSLFILYDKPNATGKEIVEESERLMKGNRGRYFCLTLSFIGWMILSSLSFGIGLLWLMPYMTIANIFFYEHLAGKDDSVEVVDTVSKDAIDTENVENNSED